MLLKELSSAEITHHLSHYTSAIEYKSQQSTNRKGETLPALDEWYQALPHTVTTRLGGIRNKDDLVRLMRWKLAREKFRPTLLSLISSNTAETCTAVLARASEFFSSQSGLTFDTTPVETLLKVVEDTMKILMQLRGVGPATSSAIVATWGSIGVFQSDELALGLLGNVKVEYTCKFYRTFYTAAVELINRWNQLEITVPSGKVLEQVAWSLAHCPTVHHRTGKHVIEGNPVAAKEVKRNKVNEQSSKRKVGTDPSPLKRNKNNSPSPPDQGEEKLDKDAHRRVSKRLRSR